MIFWIKLLWYVNDQEGFNCFKTFKSVGSNVLMIKRNVQTLFSKSILFYWQQQRFSNICMLNYSKLTVFKISNQNSSSFHQKSNEDLKIFRELKNHVLNLLGLGKNYFSWLLEKGQKKKNGVGLLGLILFGKPKDDF